MALTDTSEKAGEVYWRRLADLTPSERVRIAVGFWKAAHLLQMAGMRQQYPEASEDELRYRIAVTRFGEKLAKAAYGRS